MDRKDVSLILAEDNPGEPQGGDHTLRRLGYDIHVVTTARRRSRRSQSTHFDAVLMDCQMPVLDG
jgi:CheY-like chemotaxis protein